MEKIIIYASIIIALFLSCNFGEKQKDVVISKNEIGLIYNVKSTQVVTSGKYKLENGSKLFRFVKYDTLTTEIFDVLDKKGMSVYCKIKTTYSIYPEHLQNYLELYKIGINIDSYKDLVLFVAIRDVIRKDVEKYDGEELVSNVYVKDIKWSLISELKKYADLNTVDIEFTEKN